MTSEPFDDGFDWIIKDKKTGEQLARFHDQKEVLPFAYKVGRDTVTLKKVKREGKKEMSEQRIVNLKEMMLKVVSEEVLLPKTNNPDQEAADLTKDTGLYHYADHDDMIGKPVIVNTNVEATNEGEWLERAFNSPVNEESPVIEPSNFEKNDEYEVTDSDQVAEGYDRDKWNSGYEAFEAGHECPSDPSEKDGWMEAKKDHRKAGQMDEADYEEAAPADWTEKAIGLFKHNYLPLAYDDNSGQITLYDIDGASSLDDAEPVGMFDTVDQMSSWIADNIKQDVAEEYRRMAEDTDDNNNDVTDMATDEATDKLDEAGPINSITTNSQGVNNNDGDNYGPAPVDGQNDMEFDADGKFVIEDEQANLLQKAKEAREDSKNGYVQHVDKLGDGHYGISDWMSDDTVVSYSNGHCINGSDPLEDETTLDEAKFKPSGNSFDTYIDLPNREDVEVTVEYDVHSDDPSVGYEGGVEITTVVEKSTGDDLMDHIDPKTANRLFDLAQEDASAQEDDYGDYKYDQMRDERMERDFDEGKDYRYDPDADESDYDRTDRFKQRRQDKKDNKKDLEESDGDIQRAFMLSVTFTPEKLVIDHKGMSDTDSALKAMANGEPVTKLANELSMGGLPMSSESKGENSYTLVVLASTLREAIDSMLDIPLCEGLLNELEIGEDVFYGFLIQGKTGDTMDDSTELHEEEMFEAPAFVVSSDDLNSEELAEDTMFIQVMNEAFLEVAEKVGAKLEDFHPSMEEVDEVIALGIDNYPNGYRYSFMMTDPMARDAINDAFNILWDQGKIGSQHIA